MSVDDPGGEVVILGAGFSYAASSAMPLVKELGSGLRDEHARRRSLPGREPYLVPPTTSKASYFETLVTRELWRRAYDALKVATRVVLVGYSLPAADSTFLGLLEDTIAGQDIEAVVVDARPEPVTERLTRLGVGCSIEAKTNIKTWVAEEVRRDAHRVADQLRAWASEPTTVVDHTTLIAGWFGRCAPQKFDSGTP